MIRRVCLGWLAAPTVGWRHPSAGCCWSSTPTCNLLLLTRHLKQVACGHQSGSFKRSQAFFIGCHQSFNQDFEHYQGFFTHHQITNWLWETALTCIHCLSTILHPSLLTTHHYPPWLWPVFQPLFTHQALFTHCFINSSTLTTQISIPNDTPVVPSGFDVMSQEVRPIRGWPADQLSSWALWRVGGAWSPALFL